MRRDFSRSLRTAMDCSIARAASEAVNTYLDGALRRCVCGGSRRLHVVLFFDGGSFCDHGDCGNPLVG